MKLFCTEDHRVDLKDRLFSIWMEEVGRQAGVDFHGLFGIAYEQMIAMIDLGKGTADACDLLKTQAASVAGHVHKHIFNFEVNQNSLSFLDDAFLIDSFGNVGEKYPPDRYSVVFNSTEDLRMFCKNYTGEEIKYFRERLEESNAK